MEKIRRLGLGFSLVELMAVMAAIAILAGLLLTVAGKAMGGGRAAICVNNSGQIMLEVMRWGREHPFNSPAGESSPVLPKAQDSSGNTWASLLIAAKLPSDTLRCPEQKNAAAFAYGYGVNPLCGGIWQYASGTMEGGFMLTPASALPCFASLVDKPAHTVYLCDSGAVSDASISALPGQWVEDGAKAWKPYVAFKLTGTTTGGMVPPSYGYDWGNGYTGSGVGAMGWNASYRALPRHPKVTVGMVDGHVEMLPIEKLVTPQWGAGDCLYDNQVK